MFNTMMKMAGGIAVALVIYVLGSWVATAIYTTGGGHGEMQETHMTEAGADAPEAAAEPEATHEESSAATETETAAVDTTPAPTSTPEPAPAPEPAPTPEPAPAAPEASADSGIEALMASADLAKGEKVFKKCKACHKLEQGKNATGPSLFGIVGRDVATVDGFKYSSPMLALGGAWTPDRISEYLTKPKAMVPGTKMSFAGLKKEVDRANLIAYLATIGG